MLCLPGHLHAGNPPGAGDSKLIFSKGEPRFLGKGGLGSGNRSEVDPIFCPACGRLFVKMFPRVFAGFCVMGDGAVLCDQWLEGL